VKFGNSYPQSQAKQISPSAWFLGPEVLPATYIKRFQQNPAAEHFAIGDHYDLLLGGEEVTGITLTSLVGSPGDEGVGNYSYIGAIGKLDKDHIVDRPYYAVSRHGTYHLTHPEAAMTDPRKYASLSQDPIPFDIQTQIAANLAAIESSGGEQCAQTIAQRISPAFVTQRFALADGTSRYYVRAEWKLPGQARNDKVCALAAWMTLEPKVRVLATEQTTSFYGFEAELPQLMAVVDLGKGRTGLVVSISGEDSAYVDLVEYRDGADLSKMRVLQSIGAGE
jgi:hypothetical protein